MDQVEVNVGRVLEIIKRDAPAVLDRAMLLVRIEDLEKENLAFRASALAQVQEDVDPV